jgi:hypothetical protein
MTPRPGDTELRDPQPPAETGRLLTGEELAAIDAWIIENVYEDEGGWLYCRAGGDAAARRVVDLRRHVRVVEAIYVALLDRVSALETALRQALNQWEMYADNTPDRGGDGEYLSDSKDQDDIEAQDFWRLRALLEVGAQPHD